MTADRLPRDARHVCYLQDEHGDVVAVWTANPALHADLKSGKIHPRDKMDAVVVHIIAELHRHHAGDTLPEEYGEDSGPGWYLDEWDPRDPAHCWAASNKRAAMRLLRAAVARYFEHPPIGHIVDEDDQ